MLKQLISLFCEKFLLGKKSWVSNQSFPCNSDKVVLLGSISNKFGDIGTDSILYTAPSDGYIFTYTDDALGVCDTSINNYSNGMHISVIADDWVRLCLPVSKGQNIGIYAQSKTGSPIPFAFCPSNSSN